MKGANPYPFGYGYVYGYSYGYGYGYGNGNGDGDDEHDAVVFLDEQNRSRGGFNSWCPREERWGNRGM